MDLIGPAAEGPQPGLVADRPARLLGVELAMAAESCGIGTAGPVGAVESG